MSDCRRFETNVHPLAAGEVDGALALKLGLHAASCPACDRLLASARRVDHWLDAAGSRPAEPPADMVARIMGAIGDPRRTARRWRLLGFGFAAAMAVGVGLVLALVVASAAGISVGPQMSELRSAMSAIAGRLQQFTAVIETLAGNLPRLPSPAGGSGGGNALLPGVALVMTGLLGAVATVMLSAVRGVTRRG